MNKIRKKLKDGLMKTWVDKLIKRQNIEKLKTKSKKV